MATKKSRQGNAQHPPAQARPAQPTPMLACRRRRSGQTITLALAAPNGARPGQKICTVAAQMLVEWRQCVTQPAATPSKAKEVALIRMQLRLASSKRTLTMAKRVTRRSMRRSKVMMRSRTLRLDVAKRMRGGFRRRRRMLSFLCCSDMLGALTVYIALHLAMQCILG